MQAVEECIVLHSLKYGENSMVVKCLTKSGLKSFFVKSVLAKNKNKYPFLAYPLAITDCHYIMGRAGSLPLVKQLSLSYVSKSTGYDFRRQAISTFMAELSLKYIREESMSSDIYNYLRKNIVFLDSSPLIAASFPVKFAFGLAALLGFDTGIVDEKGVCEIQFSLEKGLSTDNSPQAVLKGEDALNLLAIIKCPENELSELNLASQSVNRIFQAMILYFRYHFPESGSMRSPEILHELMH
ncbi:MAG: hypothetical protein CVU11_06990 [Bacteroidetes bacterium HGW-Bacteroidetes-6]|jgi:DNA repair protein RecO (recombination protein O)|nr:MAG: hypothetical protein CVU11_06990 [Bacteroidetes bacterium HGW-Bacteroidetes-6]